MKKGGRVSMLLSNERGFFTLVAVTVVLTVLIGGATILSMVTTRQPVSGAMDRLDRNEATPQDMNALQNAGKDMERTARIAAGGGSFIGGGGPVPNPAGPGVLFPGEKALAGVIPRVISRVTNRASQPAQTGNNPMPGGMGGAQGGGGRAGGYNPLTDPNIKGSGSGAGNLEEVDRFGSDFQRQQPGGSGTGQDTSRPGETVIPQPGRGDTRPSTTDGDGGDYPPYYRPDRRPGKGPDWERWATDPPRKPSDGHVRPSGGTSSTPATSTPKGPEDHRH